MLPRFRRICALSMPLLLFIQIWFHSYEYPLCRGLKSCPCTPAPWGPAFGQLWPLEPAVCLSLHHTYSHLSTSPPTYSCHCDFQRFCLACVDYTYQTYVSMCLGLVFGFPSGPHSVRTTFSQLIISPAINNSNNNIINHVFIVHQHFKSIILNSYLVPIPSSCLAIAEKTEGPFGQ